jgi:hypothetical protein
MGVSKVTLQSKPELCKVPVSTLGAELSKVVSSIWPGAHKGAKCNGFRGNMGKDIKRVSRNNVGEVRDYSNAVLGIRSLVGRCVSRWSGVRKSRGRVRT